MKYRIVSFLSLLLILPFAQAEPRWAMVRTPLSGPPQAIGSYAAGCLIGATALPLSGPGYQVMRPSRNRYYGHPTLIAFVERLGRQVAADGGRLLIGDLSQPRGGPMAYGHRSHQIGLDVDIWFRQVANRQLLSERETEEDPLVPVVTASAGQVKAGLWSARQSQALRLAAGFSQVDRIFVNPIIKQALCRSESGDRDWLRKIRPWGGHDAHFHVRLRCPPGSSLCNGQDSLPPGDGCDDALEQWVWEIQMATMAPPKKPAATSERRVARLPEACAGVLDSFAVR
jgi:penicillin-insensitive murein endopeptidase